MRSQQFNLDGTGQHSVVGKTDGSLNPTNSMTVEVLCELLDDGVDPTIFSRIRLRDARRWTEDLGELLLEDLLPDVGGFTPDCCSDSRTFR